MAKRIVARVVRKGPVAYASPLGNQDFHGRGRNLRGPSRVPASSVPAHRRRKANSAENVIIWAPKKPWIKGDKAKTEGNKENKDFFCCFVTFVSFCLVRTAADTESAVIDRRYRSSWMRRLA